MKRLAAYAALLANVTHHDHRRHLRHEFQAHAGIEMALSAMRSRSCSWGRSDVFLYFSIQKGRVALIAPAHRIPVGTPGRCSRFLRADRRRPLASGQQFLCLRRGHHHRVAVAMAGHEPGRTAITRWTSVPAHLDGPDSWDFSCAARSAGAIPALGLAAATLDPADGRAGTGRDAARTLLCLFRGRQKVLAYPCHWSHCLLRRAGDWYMPGSVELMPEEAYYWNYSRHLDFGYLDHPPMVAWLIRLGTALFGQNEFGVRAGALCCGAVTATFVYKLARNLFGEAGALAALLLAQTLPYFFLSGLLMTPDAPLAAAWSASLYFLERALIAAIPVPRMVACRDQFRPGDDFKIHHRGTRSGHGGLHAVGFALASLVAPYRPVRRRPAGTRHLFARSHLECAAL